MRLSVLSQFKESASVYDNILAGTIFLYFPHRRHTYICTYWQVAKVNRSGSCWRWKGQICMYFVFYEALWLKARVYGFVDAPQRRNNLRVSLGHVTSSISITSSEVVANVVTLYGIIFGAS